MINITLDTTLDAHDDLFLRIDTLGFNHVTDSYYILLDSFYLPDDNSYEKVWAIINGLVERWVNGLRSKTKGTFYLPIEFVDEYIGFFRVRVIDNIYYFSYGWTDQYQPGDMIISKTTFLLLDGKEVKINTQEIAVASDELKTIFAISRI